MRINVKWYGWVPDVPDQRDYLYRAIRPVVRLPKEVDLCKLCSDVENQGALGSCTANALAGNLEFLDNMNDAAYKDVSRLFIYYNERLLEGTVSSDSGASLRDGIKTLRKYGSCWEDRWPYIIKYFDRRPPQTCYAQARQHRIESYHRISTLSEMLACLCEGYPFVFGFSVYESFESKRVAATGVVNMPKKSEIVLGGHAVMAVGFNRKNKRFLVRNSWGTDWGMAGYFTMPYEYLETLAADFWTIRR
ncbi:MAG: C1 family peptidase [Candidatus Omnitrophica bacterium]|nr:C1 family peptidase [Candidatus Omnitrophota bacterium]